MWNLEGPWWEYVFRAVILYAFVFFLLRVIGKKQIGELSPFDLVLLLIISESISEAITGGDTSMSAGLIAVTTFVAFNYFLDILMFKSKKIEKFLDGEPKLIISDGNVIQNVLNKEKITHEEIESVLREHGLDNINEVAYGVLETNGQISIIQKGERKRERDPQIPNQDVRI